jgi:exodeoxyribonuclease VII large subunit
VETTPSAATRTSRGPEGSEPPALSIGELYGRIDRTLRKAFPEDFWVSGEVRSFNVSPRGHCFMDLVDPKHAQDAASPVLKVKCWSTTWRRVRTTLDQLGISLDTGLVVRVRGKVEFYKPRGDISFIMTELDTDALLGKVAAERARLVKALVDEGLFDRNRRLAVPRLPLRIGLVTSPGTEGYRDFIGQLEASGMAFDVRVVATQVQGRAAGKSVALAIAGLQSEGCDVLVVVRGGGSKADLSTFDSELVARAIAASRVPVWTGIGHTGDQSVADEIANRTFITPTDCGAELARQAIGYWASVIEQGVATARMADSAVGEASLHLDRCRNRLAMGARMHLGRHADGLHRKASSLGGTAQRHLDDADRLMVKRLTLLAALPNRIIETEERQIRQWTQLLGAYDYQRQLERGYSVTRGDDGAVLRSIAGLAAGTGLVTRLADGEVHSTVDVARDEVDEHDRMKETQ